MPSQDSERFVAALAKLIKERRLALKVSHQALADKSGVNRAIISRLESGKRLPSVLALYDLSEALGLPFHDLAKEARRLGLSGRE